MVRDSLAIEYINQEEVFFFKEATGGIHVIIIP